MSAQHEYLAYRADIDGIRAFAVLSVLVFHAFPQWLPGGFVGVDVFFVISGFLITGIILSSKRDNRFSLSEFYVRRIKRIFPALALVLTFALAVGWVTLANREYLDLNKHVRSAIGFYANYRYLREALEYFDPDSHSKILLHLWSLAIEEQFYLVWPITILGIARLSRREHFPTVLLWLIGVAGVASLVYDVVLLERSQAAAFYLPHARAWELLIGCGLATWGLARDTRYVINPKVQLACAIAGLSMLLLAVFGYRADTDFPGIAALLPTVGTALLIFAGPGNPINKYLLANRAAVSIGLISYPLYLWHWPLLAFAYVCNAGETPAYVKGVLLLVSAGLAWVTYAAIEKPIRRSDRKLLITGALVGWMLLLVLYALAVKSHRGLPERPIQHLLNADPATIILGEDRGSLLDNCGLSEATKERYRFERCLNGTALPPINVVMGDSKAEALYFGLVRESVDRRWALIGGTSPSADPSSKSALAYDDVMHIESVKNVMLVNTLAGVYPVRGKNGFIADNRPNTDIRVYDNLIERFEDAGKTVVLVLDNPTLPDTTECVEGVLTTSEFLNKFLYRRLNSSCNLKYSEHLAQTKAYRDYFMELKTRHPKVRLVDLPSLLCDADADRCPTAMGRGYLYSYSNHISDYANSMIAKKVLPSLGIKTRE